MPRKLGKLGYKTPFHCSLGLGCCFYTAFLVQDFINLKEQSTFHFIKKYEYLWVLFVLFCFALFSNLSSKDLFGKTGGKFLKWTAAQLELNWGCMPHLLWSPASRSKIYWERVLMPKQLPNTRHQSHSRHGILSFLCFLLTSLASWVAPAVWMVCLQELEW